MAAWPCLASLLLALATSAQATITLQDQRGRSVELAAPAQRIVSLLPSLNDTV